MKSKHIITGVIIISLVLILYAYIIFLSFPEMLTRSQFGDMFGGINAVFSGLAFLGVIYAIFLQREDLKLQRKELELTREELKRTAEAQEKSEKALSKQAASLKVTAVLNGLSAILQHYNALIETTNSAKFGIDHISFNKYKNEADDLINKINNLIDDKQINR